MNQVAYHLTNAIYRWCGLQPGQYGPTLPLSNIWATTSGSPYLWNGVNALLTEIYNDPFFNNCPAAHNLTQTMFGAGGGIRTPQDLYLSLKSCENTPMPNPFG